MMTGNGEATPVAQVAYEVTVDEHSGGAGVRVPVPTTTARALTPQLVLAGGGGGASIVGHGWTVSGLAAVTVDASEHLPRWDGSDGAALGGVPLVAWLDAAGAPRRRVEGGYQVATLRPRSGFARVRVERWTHAATGDVHYRSRDEADVLTVYGARPQAAARVVDPADPARVAAWLPELQVDADGNALWLDYAPEDARGVDRTQPWEPWQPVRAQRYLAAIRYGNVTPLAVTDGVLAGVAPAARWAFHLVVDHGDHGDAGPGALPTFAPDRPWPARPDAYATARDGFVVRTYRRVRRFVCFHELPALGPAPVPVSALELGYDDDPAGARLTSITRVGFVGGQRTATAPLTFGYAGAGVDETFLPAATTTGLTAARTQLVDLYGEGLPGILYQGERGWLYQANQGGGRFAAPAAVTAQPNLERGVALADVDRDGDTELAVTTGRQAGSFALEREERRWAGFRPFAAWPKLEGTAGRTFWIDWNGDGRTDAVIARGDALVWFPSVTGPLDEREVEFGEPVVVPLPRGGEAAPGCGPDPQLDLFFADMTGDGMQDLVRVRRGTVEYWPSLGNGRFGDRVVMDGAPAVPGVTFDSARVRLVDLDGSGTADVLYLDDGRLWHFPNLGGRALGARRLVGHLPAFDGRTAAIADLAGDGRPSLLWSSATPQRAHALQYLPLVPAVPPGMLTSVDDGCGRRTELGWGNSATHYLRDAAAGVPWETRLPAHRPVVEQRVELDLIGGTSVTTRYRYRDGFFDGAGGAFRGFGRVEMLDVARTISPAGAPPIDEPAFAPPLLTRTWFHLGTPMWNHHRPFEPYTGDELLAPLAPHVEAPGPHRPADASAALRLLAGSVVRRERWAVDADEAPVAHPFDVEEATYQVVQSQPRHGAQRPVFGVVPRAKRVASYEGAGGDPRVTEELVLAHDAWGAPTRTATVAYARRGDVDDAAQSRTWVAVTDATRTDVDTDGGPAAQFLLGAEVATRQYELVGVAPVAGRITPEALTSPAVTAALAAPAPFEQALDPSAPTPAARPLAWQRTYYWDAARAAVAPLRAVARAPRVHHTEVACLTPGLLAATLGARVDAAAVAALGYVLADGHWWQRGPTQEVAGAFGLVTRTVRGDGAAARMIYDADELAVVETIDALGLSTALTIDYRVLAPARTEDPNGTVAHAIFDGLGRPIAGGTEGHIGSHPWGSGPLPVWAPPAGATTASVLADPAGFLGAAATATWLDDQAWVRDGTPVAQVTIARSRLVHDGDGGGDAGGPLEVRVRYLDGFGRVLQEKVRVEPGPAIARDASGDVIVDASGEPVLAPAAERWRVSGHVVYDAKGQPGRVYEPYFSPSAAYEGDAVLERFGMATVTSYDAVGRAVRVDLPNGTYATTAYGAWSTTAASPGDNVLGSTYRLVRETRPAGDAERAAYEHAAAHAATPTVSYVDARGAACAVVAVGDASAPARSERTVTDASGQVTALVDARGLVAFTYARDLRGRPLAEASVDAGPTWALADAYDRPVWTWDGRGFVIERQFDAADRPVAVHVRGGDGPAALDAVVETVRYGDEEADRTAARAANTLGRAVRVRDEAGEVETLAYDPAGAVRSTARRLRVDVDEAPDWRGAVALEAPAEALTAAARMDALGRVVWARLADGTERVDAYHLGGALAAVRLTTPNGALVDQAIVDGIVRDAHGRVAAQQLGNGCAVAWRYDRETGRLVEQDAVRAGRQWQGLRYTYDADGLITRALDVAQDGAGAIVPAAVSARRDFAYDAHGRLVEATGRVHQALLPQDGGPATAGSCLIGGARHLSLNNGAALERFTQRFTYDPAGNLRRMQHAGATASWATDYWVAAGSNRSVLAVDGNGVPVPDVDAAASFDARGNLTRLAHLRSMTWSWRGCLATAVTVERAGGSVDDGERYAYGADRMRVRKVETRLVAATGGGADGSQPVIETREVVYLGGGQERVRVRRGSGAGAGTGTTILERWTTHVEDGERRVAVLDRHTVDTLAAEVDAIGPARVRYQLTTPQGSASVELDETGRLISYEEYLPHGASAFIAGDDAREVARRDVRYAGKERDRATGLQAYPYRYYAPWLARWLTCDPIGPKDGLNLYAFVGGDPIGMVDPEGLETEWAWVTDEEGNPTALYRWNGQAYERYDSSSEPSETIVVEDSKPTPEQERQYDLRLFGNREELISTLHRFQEHQSHIDAANRLAGIAIEKWGGGKVRSYLGDFDFWGVTQGVSPGDVSPLLGSVEDYLAAQGEAKDPNDLANASAGFGNGITFGLIGWANRQAGLDTAYNETSGAFRYGNYGGAAAGIFLSGGASALEHGLSRAAVSLSVGAGIGLSIGTLQTGADLLDGKDVTWRGYLEQAGISTLYGAYGGAAFGFAGSTGRAVLGVVGSGVQLGQGLDQIANGNYARGILDVGLGGLGGYLTLRSTPPSRVTERNLLEVVDSPSPRGTETPKPDLPAPVSRTHSVADRSIDYNPHGLSSRDLRRAGVNPLNMRRLRREMGRSEIGRKVLAAIDEGVITLEISTARVPSTLLGESVGRVGTVFIRSTQSYVRTAETAIHEGIHALGVGGSVRAEALARIGEVMHRGEAVTFARMRRILTEIRSLPEHYGHLPPRKGKWSSFLGVRF